MRAIFQKSQYHRGFVLWKRGCEGTKGRYVIVIDAFNMFLNHFYTV